MTLTYFLASFAFCTLACVLGAVAGLWANRYFPRRQYVKPVRVIYSVARFDCGCVLTNGKLSVCQAHLLLEDAKA